MSETSCDPPFSKLQYCSSNYLLNLQSQLWASTESTYNLALIPDNDIGRVNSPPSDSQQVTQSDCMSSALNSALSSSLTCIECKATQSHNVCIYLHVERFHVQQNATHWYHIFSWSNVLQTLIVNKHTDLQSNVWMQWTCYSVRNTISKAITMWYASHKHTRASL